MKQTMIPAASARPCSISWSREGLPAYALPMVTIVHLTNDGQNKQNEQMRKIKSTRSHPFFSARIHEYPPPPPSNAARPPPLQPAETNVRSRLWVAYQQLAKRGRDQSTQKQFNQFFTVGEGQVYIVSMGHRLQTISFSQENSTVSSTDSLLVGGPGAFCACLFCSWLVGRVCFVVGVVYGRCWISRKKCVGCCS